MPECLQCRQTFDGREIARYCSNACRQKSYRARSVPPAPQASAPGPSLDESVDVDRWAVEVVKEIKRLLAERDPAEAEETGDSAWDYLFRRRPPLEEDAAGLDWELTVRALRRGARAMIDAMWAELETETDKLLAQWQDDVCCWNLAEFLRRHHPSVTLHLDRKRGERVDMPVPIPTLFDFVGRT